MPSLPLYFPSTTKKPTTKHIESTDIVIAIELL